MFITELAYCTTNSQPGTKVALWILRCAVLVIEIVADWVCFATNDLVV